MVPNNSPLRSEREIKRKQLLLKQRVKEEHLKKRWLFYRNLTTDLRRFFSIILTVTCVLLVVSHRTLIENKIQSNISQIITLMQSNAKNSRIRQSAINHEKEIDQITK